MIQLLCSKKKQLIIKFDSNLKKKQLIIKFDTNLKKKQLIIKFDTNLLQISKEVAITCFMFFSL